MQWYFYVLIGIAVLFILLFVISYVQSKGASTVLATEEFKKNMRKGQLIDVRSKREFDAGHINGARNMAVGALGREHPKLRKDQPIYLYCASGKRSKRAAIYLKAKGYSDLYELESGLKAWNGALK